MRVLVMTVVHHPLDARITHRQVAALTRRGHQVTVAAPWASAQARPPAGVRPLDLPRTRGLRRLGPLIAALRLLRRERNHHDLVLAHDIDLVPVLLAARLRRDASPVPVLDVHEDTAAAVASREWVPRFARGVAMRMIHALERIAERRMHLLLAEESYRSRFASPHPVIPNTAWLSSDPSRPAGDGKRDRVVHVGSLTTARGADELARLGSRLRPEGIEVVLVGPVHGRARGVISRADADGDVRWLGELPNDRAMAEVDGAIAGVSLLHDEPNYRGSLPTKVIEYMAHEVPVITTPLPLAADVVRRAGAGEVVGWGPTDEVAGEVARIVQSWRDDPAHRAALGRAGRQWVAVHGSWEQDGPRFVDVLDQWVVQSRRT